MEEAPVLETDFWQVYRDQGLIVLAIGAGESVEQACDWKTNYSLTFPVLSDINEVVYDQYGDGYVPYNAVIDGDKVLRYSTSGFYEDELIAIIEQYLAFLLRIEHTPHPDTEDTTNDYLIEAQIFSNYPLIESSLKLYWNTTGEPPFNEVPLTNESGNTYYAYIPAQSWGTDIYYYLYAENEHGQVATHPEGAPDVLNHFYVGLDTTPPTIEHTPLTNIILDFWPPTVTADVTDNLGIDSVYLQYHINNGQENEIEMTNIEGSTYEAQFSGEVQIGDVIYYRIRAVDASQSHNESYHPESGYHQFKIIEKYDALIFDPDPTSLTGTYLQEVFNELGINYRYSRNLPDNLSYYYSIFVCLGIFSNNHKLTNSEGTQLKNFLDNGGRIYMEGGDTWFFDDQTPVHPYFHINGLSDGSGDLTPVSGIMGTFTEGMYFNNYTGENNYIDRLAPVGTAVVIFDNVTPSYHCAIAYDGGTYKTVGASFELGGLVDALYPSTRKEIVRRILEFFDIEIPASPTPTPAITSTPTLIPSPTPTTNLTPTNTPIYTYTPEPTKTATFTPTNIPSTSTPIPPTFTIVPTSTPTAFVPTSTPEPMETSTPGPTNTPTPTKTPVPTTPPTFTPLPTYTPTPMYTVTVDLELNKEVYYPGDRFTLTSSIKSYVNKVLNVDDYIVLQVFDMYFFWPSWVQYPDIDRKSMNLVPYGMYEETILDFIWPEGAGTAENITFWSLITEKDTFNVISNIESVSFSYYQ